MAKSVQQKSFQALIQYLKKEIHEGMARAEMAFQAQRVLTYWKLGTGMHRFLAAQKETDTFHLKKIEAEMNISLDVLRKIVKFYRVFPKLPKNPLLSWSQYRALLTAPEDMRDGLKARAVKEGLGSEKIYALISGSRKKMKQKALGLDGAKVPRLNYVRGRLFVYKTLQSKKLGLKANKIMVDCGFKIKHKVDIPPSSRITGGSLVLSVKTKKGYALKQSLKDDRKLYTYAARVIRVIDADTFFLTVDVGFDIWIDMTVRLRGINASEMTTHEGVRARQFVVDRLKVSKTVVIKSYWMAKYGRYLVDLYYLRKKKSDPLQIAREGIFLNQQLLDEGLAGLYEK